MSLVSVVEDVIVKKRKLLTQNEILEGITLANFLPGPMAVNVVIFVGYKIGGIRGAICSATGVILPSFVLIVILSEIYFNYGEYIDLNRIFKGIVPAVAAVVFSVALRMFNKNSKSLIEKLLVLFSFSALLLVPEQWKIYSTHGILLFYGILGYFVLQHKFKNSIPIEPPKEPTKLKFSFAIVIFFFVALISATFFTSRLEPDGLLKIASTFSSLSVLLFGGGYVFIPMIKNIVVDNYGWITNQQFIDGIAMGQFTPGPIVISVAFIGYHVKGISGALIATIAIFLPPGMLMILTANIMDQIKNNPKVINVLATIRLAIIGMIFYAGAIIYMNTLPLENIISFDTLMSVIIFISAYIAIKKFNVSIILVILSAGVVGYIFQ